MSERKELTVPYADQPKTLAKLKKDGWTILGIQFSDKPTHCVISAERDEKPVTKTVARISVPMKTAKAKVKQKGKRKGSK